MIDDRTRTAYHESGHAIVSAALGVTVTKVTIIPDGDSFGRCTHYRVSHCDTAVAILLAGGLAVWELGWRRGVKLSSTCYGDLEKFDGLMREWSHHDGTYDPATREEWDEYKDGERLALETLSNYWGAVDALAAALLECGTVRGELVHALVAAHKAKAERRNIHV